MKLVHGGDWAGFEREYGAMPLDFSANVSPLGLPDGVRCAVIAALDEADRYPDPLCRALREKLARHLSVDAKSILCGNGAADLIFRLVRAAEPNRALVTAPTFSEYEQALNSVGCCVERLTLHEKESFDVTDSILSHITPNLDMLFLCEPNNPTGRVTPRELLLRILEKCEQCGTILVVDECFNEFLDEPRAHTLQGELDRARNLVILRAFTKWYGMAGIRLGYVLCSDETLLEKMRCCGQPWSVSSLAQAAGIAALDEAEYSAHLRALIACERPRLLRELEALGCRAIPGSANYILFFHPETQLVSLLRRKGILLRSCDNYAGLGPGWYRTAVRTHAENDALLKALREVL